MELNSGNILKWKHFQSEYSWRVVSQIDELDSYTNIDWNAYHKNREWWRTLSELQKFLV